MAVVVVERAEATSALSVATEDLIRAISSTNRTSGRRSCTMVLNQLKKEIFPTISTSTLIDALEKNDGCGGDTTVAGDCFNPCDDIKGSSILTALIMIINQHDDFSTEAHREASVEILKYLSRRAFGDDNQHDAGDGKESRHGKRLHATLLRVYHRCSQVFQKRMSFYKTSNNNSFRPGTMTGPMETSEHTRLLLVELMVDLGRYCLTSRRKDCFTTDDENCNKKIIEATSITCQILAKSTLLDPNPEIPRAALDLVQLIAHLCPLAVRMNAKSLLVSISGRDNGSVVGVEQHSTSITTPISRKCLMRHRHSKTRCKAVHASVDIVLCCPRVGEPMQVKDGIENNMESAVVDYLANYGSHSTSMEHVLHHNLLPEWEDLLKLDTSASVKLAVLKSLGSIVKILRWRYTPNSAITSCPPTESATDHSIRSQPNTATTDVITMVEAHVLTLFLVGASSGCVADVRSLAVEQLRSLAFETNEGMLPMLILGSYFAPMLELLLSSCSSIWTVCQKKVSSLQTLQVLLSITTLLMKSGSSDPITAIVTNLGLSDAMIHAIVNVLSTNILSDEKEVVEAAFACCHTVGVNDFISNATLGLLCNLDDVSASVTDGANLEKVVVHSNESEVAPSPRHLTSRLLILNGLLKGFVNSKDATSILCEADQTLAFPTPHWFHASPSSAKRIAKFFCHTTITNNVASSSSLAWALADACDSFIKCVHHSKAPLSEDVIVDVLVSVAFLLGCPAEYGISSQAVEILRSFSSQSGYISPLGSNYCEAEGLSLFDVHFRKVFGKITAIAPTFPWKQSEPALSATDALLRACSGSTTGSNFDLVAPFFISHLTTSGYKNNSADGSNADKLNDEWAEEYSIRISLMALLQTILSDKSFSRALSTQQCAQFTTDVVLSIVVPNLVWRVGGMASALRKLALATLFSLLIGRTGFMHPDMVPCLIPTLHSNFDDSESSIRELACVCLTLTLQQISNETFTITWETNPQVIDTILPRLLELFDDNHGPIRIAACKCLRVLYPLVQSNISQSLHETMTACMLIHLDDPDEEFRSDVFQTLLELVECQRHDSGVVRALERQINTSIKLHRDESHCRELLVKLAEL